jgi:hypothetical protein
MRKAKLLIGLIGLSMPAIVAAQSCDQACLEGMADRYRAAYAKRAPREIPVAADVKYTENNVSLRFPDGSWDAITAETGPALTFSDPKTGNVAVFTTIMMNDTPAFLTARLKVAGGRITEIEHMMSTKRGVSGPPTPFGDVTKLKHDPAIAKPLEPSRRRSRDEVLRVADGYFKTLSRNNGVLHTRFAPECHRIENGYETAADGCATGFIQGRFAFNERVRREFMMVDEVRGIAMARGFIDHKGVMNHYKLTDGTDRQSPFREPHSWSFLELFKIVDGEIRSVEATFIGSVYYSTTPWSKKMVE